MKDANINCITVNLNLKNFIENVLLKFNVKIEVNIIVKHIILNPLPVYERKIVNNLAIIII
jgi:hypothetical protein